MYRLFYFSLFCITSAVGFAACAHTDKQAADLQDIKILEGKTYQATRLEPQLAIKIIEKYSNYATNYPTDTANAPKFWVKAGEVANAIGKGNEAIELWHHVLADYATKPLAAQALFMTAFAYENTLHEEANARRYYTQFLQKYPTHPLAKDAQAAISNMGLSAEELVKKFEQQNQPQ